MGLSLYPRISANTNHPSVTIVALAFAWQVDIEVLVYRWSGCSGQALCPQPTGKDWLLRPIILGKRAQRSLFREHRVAVK